MTAVVLLSAGLAGLACARTLQAADPHCRAHEACECIDGRARSDAMDGFVGVAHLLDTGLHGGTHNPCRLQE